MVNSTFSAAYINFAKVRKDRTEHQTIAFSFICSFSSLIERAFSFLKAVVTPSRNRLELRQLERLLVLGMNLPDDLSSFDVSAVLKLM